MREILFRGKRKDNGYWIYGNFNFYPDINRTFIRKNNKELLPSMQTSLEDEVISKTVGQYTGLTDKNGKKIFEGDIVKDEQAQMLGKVVYAIAADGFDGMAGFMVDDIDDGLQNYNGFWHLVEVIGNIHDNPELLEGVNNGST
jgi:uncharacterized phage protein (TIGR01671 family)